MANYVLSVKADEDVDAIADYSLEKWGEKQTLVYIEELFNCLEKIATSPEIGRDASEFSHSISRNFILISSEMWTLASPMISNCLIDANRIIECFKNIS